MPTVSQHIEKRNKVATGETTIKTGKKQEVPGPRMSMVFGSST
jgi:hypothetical protein